jgi:hypothetical protein
VRPSQRPLWRVCIRHVTEPAGRLLRSSSAHSLVPPLRTPRTTLFLPSPSESSPPPRLNNNWVPDPLDVFSVPSSSESPPPPPRLSARETHVTVHGAPACTAAPARNAQVASQGTAPRARSSILNHGGTCARDNPGSNELMHVLQNAFESNWYGPGNTNTSPEGEKEEKKRMKNKPTKEIVVAEGSDDDGEEKAQANLPTSLN